jgi:hypothetical protein
MLIGNRYQAREPTLPKCVRDSCESRMNQADPLLKEGGKA